MHSLPGSHVGPGTLPADTSGWKGTRPGAREREKPGWSQLPACPEPRGRGEGVLGHSRPLLARGSHAPGRALALGARPPLHPPPSRPRALAPGAGAARAGRGSGASQALRTFAAGAAPGPEWAPPLPQPRGPGRSVRRSEAAGDLPDAPCSCREVSKVGVCGRRRGCGEQSRAGASRPRGAGREPALRRDWGPGSLRVRRRGRRGGRGEPGPLHCAGLGGGTARLAAEGPAEGMLRSPGREGSRGPERAGARARAGARRRADAARAGLAWRRLH